MRKHVRFWLVGFFGLLAAANAQTASPPAPTAQFDGTYAFVAATTVNETFARRGSRIGQCPDRRATSLVIANGQARLPMFEGPVGPQGELVMRRHAEPVKWGITPGVEATINGKIENNGTVRARQIGYGCSYDLVWQKQAK